MFERHGDTARVSCVADDDRRHAAAATTTHTLTCVDDEWQGRYTNCTSRDGDVVLGGGGGNVIASAGVGTVLYAKWLPFPIGITACLFIFLSFMESSVYNPRLYTIKFHGMHACVHVTLGRRHVCFYFLQT